MPVLADLALKGTLVLLAALVASRLLRDDSAATRHLVWSTALGSLLLLPLAALVVPEWRVPVPAGLARWLPGDGRPADVAVTVTSDTVWVARDAGRAAEALVVAPPTAPHGVRRGDGSRTWNSQPPAAVRRVRPDRHAHAEAALSVDTVVVATAATASPRRVAYVVPARASAAAGPLARLGAPLGDGRWAVALWLLGTFAVLARLVLGHVGLGRVARRARSVTEPAWLALVARTAGELGIRRPVTLLVTDRRTVPVTWGIVYPVVLLPADAAAWDEERRRLVLLHELAHVRRLDAATHVVTQLALAMAWFNPLAWLAATRVRAERELACDDLVLAHGTRPSRYADDLLQLACALQPESGAPAFASMAMARPHELEGRLRAILDPRRRRGQPSPLARALTALTAVALVVPLVALRAEAAAPSAALAAAPAVEIRTTDTIVRLGVPPAPPVPPVPPVSPVPPEAPLPPAPPPSPMAAPAPLALPAPPAPPPATSILGAVPAPPAPPALPSAPPAPPRPEAPAPPPPPTLPPTPPAPPAATAQDCTEGRHRAGTVLRATRSDDRSTTHLIVDEGRCVLVAIRGEAALADDDGDLRPEPGGSVRVVEVARGAARELTIDRGRDGRETRRYLVDGRERDAAESAAWLRELLPRLVRETGMGAEQRVARLRRQGGVPAVLREVERMESDGVRRLYLATLIESGGLGRDDLGRIAAAAGRIGSDGDARYVLAKLAEEPEVPVASVLAAARGIGSDGDKRYVLTTIAPRVRDDADWRRYVEAAATIASDGDQRVVFGAALEHGRLSRDAAVELLDATRTIESDGDRRVVLTAAARRLPLDDDRVSAAFDRAAGGIRSDGDRRVVVEAGRAARRP